MKKIIKYILLVLLGILVIATFVFLWNKSRPVKENFEIVSALKQNIQKNTVATGKIEPRDEVLIKPQISGIITEIYKEAGERVKKGDVNAKVKVNPGMRQLSNATKHVTTAKQRLDLSKK